MKQKIFYLLFVLSQPLLASGQNAVLLLSGKVVRADSKTPLPDATIRIKGSSSGVTCDAGGAFVLSSRENEGTLIVSFIGFKSREITFNPDHSENLLIELNYEEHTLQEAVVSTGYQQIHKERATGSFVQVDNQLLNRRVSTDILSRLEDVTSGVIFNKGVTSSNASTQISIRGQSTINANVDPLIVVDNFPYDGNLTNINPNDVESITILKDAAAASIWGARAGNGVIIISTKRGAFNKPAQVMFNSNVTVGRKPNVFYPSQMRSSDFIDIEKKLFSQGFYDSAEQADGHAPLTPVVELLIAKRDGAIQPGEADAEIDALKKQDVRNDIEKYMYQKSVSQQYAVNINGGTPNQRYFYAAGYDRNLDNLIRNGYTRATVSGNNTWNFLNKRLEISAGFNYVESNTSQNNPGISLLNYGPYGSPVYPYAVLADAGGKPLSIVKDFRTSFIAGATQAGLLDWEYRPLEEIQLADNYTTISDTRLNSSVSYKFSKDLKADLLYQYEKSLTNGNNFQSLQSYYTRNLVNTFSYTDQGGLIAYHIPKGGILDQNTTDLYSHNFRAQLNYDHTWLKNNISAVAGYEIKAINTVGNINRLYGYDEEHATSQPVDYISQFDQYPLPGSTSQIPNIASSTGLTDHFRSYYANTAYNFDHRYTISGSARIDQSNLFGVKTNQKGVPLWSAGIGWNINNEKFYHAEWLPFLKLRATYGYNGNVAKNISAYTTAFYGFTGAPVTNLPYATIQNPPNPQLRWERIQTINLGLDFSSKNNIIDGSLEFYRKKGMDLIGTIPFAPSTGIKTFTGNTANTAGSGFDLTLNSRNLDGVVTWTTNLLLSHQTDKVTSYASTSEVSAYIGLVGYPVAGKPLYSIYSYRWAGLDPQTGNPQGYVDGKISNDYSGIIYGAKPENIIFNGSARPTIFGSLRNTIRRKNISFSANIAYRFNYYFRKNSVNYSNILSGLGGSGDYATRWMHPGDESHTYIPSLPESIDQNRDNFYLTSQVLVAKADNIRLQDITLSYDLNRLNWRKLPFSHIQVYAYGNNLVLLWKANHFGIDPDYQGGRPPRTFALGLKIDF
jgi:TonB-linked SusC/RagA family outer membrane protein